MKSREYLKVCIIVFLLLFLIASCASKDLYSVIVDESAIEMQNDHDIDQVIVELPLAVDISGTNVQDIQIELPAPPAPPAPLPAPPAPVPIPGEEVPPAPPG